MLDKSDSLAIIRASDPLIILYDGSSNFVRWLDIGTEFETFRSDRQNRGNLANVSITNGRSCSRINREERSK